MVYRGPSEATRRAAWTQARRAAALRHHPDRGGDAVALQAELDAVDRRFDTEVAGSGSPWTRTTRQALHRGRRAARRTTRTVRGRLPKGWPGRRRYIDL